MTRSIVVAVIIIAIFLFYYLYPDRNGLEYYERVWAWDNYQDSSKQQLTEPTGLDDSLFYLKVEIKRQNQVNVTKKKDLKLEALRISKELNDNIAIADSYIDLAYLTVNDVNSDSFNSYLDSALNTLPEDPILEFQVNRAKYGRAQSVYRSVDAVQYLIKCDSILRNKAPWAKDLLLGNLMNVFHTTDINPPTSILPAGELTSTSNDKNIRMAKKKYYVSLFNQALKKQPDSARSLIPLIQKYRYNKDVSHHWAKYYRAIKDYDSGIAVLTKAISNYNPEHSYLGNRYLLLANLYNDKNACDSSFLYLDLARSRGISENHFGLVSRVNLLKADIFNKNNCLDSAKRYIENVICSEHSSPFSKYEAYNQLKEIAINAGDYQGAHKMGALADDYLTEVRNTSDQRKAREIWIEYVSSVLNNDIIEHEKNRVQELIFMATILFLLVLLVLGLFFYAKLQISKSKEIKSLNQSLIAINENLDKKVEERTNEIRSKNEELEIKNDQLSTHAFVNAHKLRAPVASILGLSSLIIDGEAKNMEYERVAGMLKIETNKLDSIVKEIQENLEDKFVEK